LLWLQGLGKLYHKHTNKVAQASAGRFCGVGFWLNFLLEAFQMRIIMASKNTPVPKSQRRMELMWVAAQSSHHRCMCQKSFLLAVKPVEAKVRPEVRDISLIQETSGS